MERVFEGEDLGGLRFDFTTGREEFLLKLRKLTSFRYSFDTGIDESGTDLIGDMSKSILTGLPGREASSTVWLVKISLVSCLILLSRSFMALLSSICC